ncbi:MAG: hypothetical protein HY821_24835 [Acidobacteria bacterium]|nr:hypothetical protein [Acidobacteriota bacterium]
MLKTILITTIAALSAGAADWPSAEITNGVVTAKLYLPDPDNGYYRGTRFDWSGQIASLKTKNHEYFGQWFERYDPKLHDAILGPVEEFRTAGSALGYDQAQVGGGFVRIGIGVLKKPEEKGFVWSKTYEFIDHGKWETKKGKDWVEFRHALHGPAGYDYVYTKKIRLVKGASRMVIEHTLKNTGTAKIETFQYNHNFFVMDAQPTGPDASVKFPFTLSASRKFQGGFAEERGNEIVFLKELQMGQSTIAEFKPEGPQAGVYDVRMEHRKAGAGVRIQGNIPIDHVVFWAIRKTFCPEPYVKIEVEPGKQLKWNYDYEFYDLAK